MGCLSGYSVGDPPIASSRSHPCARSFISVTAGKATAGKPHFQPYIDGAACAGGTEWDLVPLASHVNHDVRGCEGGGGEGFGTGLCVGETALLVLHFGGFK